MPTIPDSTTGDATQSLSAEVRTLKLSDHVGFDSLPNQLVNKAVSQGFDFNILCIGETGIGKSTLIDTLFNQKFELEPSSHELDNPLVKEHTFALHEAGVKLRLNIAETSGFGDQLDKQTNIQSIVDYIDAQFENYLQEELKIKRSFSSFHDTRVHACLYFLAPTGHSLKSLDIFAMKQIDKKVNIILVIAKSDTVTKSELAKFKEKILADAKSNDINLYQFPTDDEAVKEANSKMNKILPFAVVGSNDEESIGGKKVHVRKYPWGLVEVENESHCDFIHLREMILNVNMEDLRERTHTENYETYRRQRLTDMGFRDDDKLSLLETYEKRRAMMNEQLQQKEINMRDLFVKRVQEKDLELKEAERKIQADFEERKKKYMEEKNQLEFNKRQLNDEIAAFERRKQAVELARQNSSLKKKK